MKISKKGIDFIKHFESFRSKAYLCLAEVWTVGFGFTIINGVQVKQGDTMTLEVAGIEIKKQLRTYENVVKKCIMMNKINQNQYDALVSLCFNIGGSSFRRSDIVKHINNRNFIEAIKIFNLWSSVNKKRSKGLLRRRISERNLFCSWPDPIVKNVPNNYREIFKEL